MIDALLRRLGIDPKRFRILVDLFHKLSDRKELLDQQLGFNQRSLTGGAVLFAILGALLALLLLMGKTESAAYFATFQFLSGFMLGSILLAETANTLVNPQEGMVLVHQPINGATYTAAKLVHLGRVVLYVVGAINVIPALLGLFAENASASYPARHMAAAFAVGTGIAFACCAMFGWLMRFVPPARMKTAAQVASALSYIIVMPQVHAIDYLKALWRHLPDGGGWANAGMAVAFVSAVLLGLRALSADYLIRVTRMVQGGSRKRTGGRARRGPLALPGRAVSRFFGGPPARAGFAYLGKMVARDWQFRRQIIGFLPALIVAVAATRSFDSPFGTKFSTVHLLPHTLGLMAFFVCTILKAGSHPKAVWLFQLTPASAFPRFANGIYAGLWGVLVAAPHAVAIPAMFWKWPAADAASFALFSIAFLTLYVSLSLTLVDGLPFGHAPEAAQPSWMMGVLMGGGVVAAILVAVQHYYLFRSHVGVMGAAMAVGALAAALGRRSAGRLGIAMLHYMNVLAQEKRSLYQEVQT